MPASNPHWCDAVSEAIEAHGFRGGFAVCFAEYRPDLVRELASEVNVSQIDFRAERMAPLGWSASDLGVEELDAVIQTAIATGQGVALQNGEALLVCKTEQERRRWLAATLCADWPYPVIIPVVLLSEDLPEESSRIVRFNCEDLPQESLLVRLAGL